MHQLRAPSLLHVIDRAFEFRLLFPCALMTARRRFVMNQIRVRRPDDAITALRQAQTKIDVVEGDAEIHFIESAQLFEHRFARRHARAGDGRTILLEHCTIEIARMPARNIRKRVPGHSPETNNHAAMLQGAVGIPEPRAHRADLRARGVTDHLGQPTGVIDLRVVVEKNEDVAARRRRSAIVQPAVVERAVLNNDANALVRLALAKKRARLFFDRAIIDHDDFERLVIGPRSNAFNAAFQQSHSIARRNDNRCERRRRRQRVNHAMGFCVLGAGHNRRGHFVPFAKIRDGAPGRFFRVRLRIRNRGQTPADHSPVIQDARNVPDLFRPQPFDAAQSQIVILRAFESFAKSVDLTQQIGAVTTEMVDVILPEKKFRVPIRFEEWIRARAFFVDLVFVGINEARVWMLRDLQRDKSERVFRERVVLIEKRAPFARRQLQGRVRARGDVPVALPKSQFDSRVRRGGFFQERPHLRVGGRVVGDAQFPVFVNLMANGVDGRFEKIQVGIVDRKNN